jgi:hypothetical protein
MMWSRATIVVLSVSPLMSPNFNHEWVGAISLPPSVSVACSGAALVRIRQNPPSGTGQTDTIIYSSVNVYLVYIVQRSRNCEFSVCKGMDLLRASPFCLAYLRHCKMNTPCSWYVACQLLDDSFYGKSQIWVWRAVYFIVINHRHISLLVYCEYSTRSLETRL